MRVSGAEIICKILMEQGVDTIFGYPGGAVLPIYDALYDHRDKIKHYITAHEQGAAHAADGYARATGKTGVVLATSGPGMTNLVTGIATAYMDSIPMVAITGNVASSLIGKDSFQEVYTMGITMPITKHNFFVQDVNDLAETLREAFRIAGSGRKGPVLIDITKDATINEGEFHSGKKFEEKKKPFDNKDALKKVVEYIDSSRQPLICFGGGVVGSEANAEMYELVHKMDIPAVHSIMGTGVLSWNDPLNIGMVGMHGRFSGNKALDQADLIIAVGFRFSDRVALNPGKFGRNAKFVQIDIDPSEVNKNVKVDYSVIGDIKQVLQKLIPMLDDTKHPNWIHQIDEWKKADYQEVDSETKLKPHQIIGAITEAVGEDGIMATDVGQHQMWAVQYCCRTRPRSFLTSGGLGTMGFGYGAAIGAKVAQPQRKVVHITGDGSFHMNMNEVATAVSYKIPVVTVVINNDVLGMVRQWQHSFYDDRYSNTTLSRATDYVKTAEGFGAKGYRAETIAEFKKVLQEALEVDGPVWIECPIGRDEQVLPMIPNGGTVENIIMG
ncbi:biosynthetic-type acetolactate synthase large subunit [Scatolibacter rhodanostii]|uniref:biosynthetic-type acetolactate synthase large subunit n=1 Tax=Scatolibacter rhodanostii TaxID=2014781 RepID=UPI000C079E97|nr:biosynthetic-type acetolactate synthase large subunit [Scatolibacter rhodanostii]